MHLCWHPRMDFNVCIYLYCVYEGCVCVCVCVCMCHIYTVSMRGVCAFVYISTHNLVVCENAHECFLNCLIFCKARSCCTPPDELIEALRGLNRKHLQLVFKRTSKWEVAEQVVGVWLCCVV